MSKKPDDILAEAIAAFVCVDPSNWEKGSAKLAASRAKSELTAAGFTIAGPGDVVVSRIHLHRLVGCAEFAQEICEIAARDEVVRSNLTERVSPQALLERSCAIDQLLAAVRAALAGKAGGE